MKRRLPPLYGPYGSGRTLRICGILTLVVDWCCVGSGDESDDDNADWC